MDELERDVIKWYNRYKYNRIGSDLSVTELLNPPRIIHLQNRYNRKPVDELPTIMPSFIGNGVHEQLQRYLRDESRVNNNWLIERRLCNVVNGVRISGRFDAMFERRILYDIKTCKVFKIRKGDFSDWETQLNIYRWMLHDDGIDISELKIYVVIIDWVPSGLRQDKGYPKRPMYPITIPMWDLADTEKYLRDRVQLWKDTRDLSDDNLPLCSDEERWASKPIYKLFRLVSHKRATKTFPTEERAKKYLAACKKQDADKWKEGFIQKATGDAFKRCEKYCSVADHCNQFKQKLT